MSQANTQTPLPSGNVVNTAVVVAIVALVLGTIALVVGLVVFIPDQPAVVAMILGFAGPTVVALIAMAVGIKATESKLNGRLEQLLKVTKEAAHAQGVTDERSGVPSPTTPEIAAAEKHTEAKP